MQLQGREYSYTVEILPPRLSFRTRSAVADTPFVDTKVTLHQANSVWSAALSAVPVSSLKNLINWLTAILWGQPISRTLRLEEYLIAYTNPDPATPDLAEYRFNLVVLRENPPAWWHWYEIKPYTVLITGYRSELESLIDQLTQSI